MTLCATSPGYIALTGSCVLRCNLWACNRNWQQTIVSRSTRLCLSVCQRQSAIMFARLSTSDFASTFLPGSPRRAVHWERSFLNYSKPAQRCSPIQCRQQHRSRFFHSVTFVYISNNHMLNIFWCWLSLGSVRKHGSFHYLYFAKWIRYIIFLSKLGCWIIAIYPLKASLLPDGIVVLNLLTVTLYIVLFLFIFPFFLSNCCRGPCKIHSKYLHIPCVIVAIPHRNRCRGPGRPLFTVAKDRAGYIPTLLVAARVLVET